MRFVDEQGLSRHLVRSEPGEDLLAALAELATSQQWQRALVIDPQHPIPAHHDPAGERRRWNGVVAPLHRFAGTHPKPSIEKPQPVPDAPPEHPDTPPETPKPSGPPIQLRIVPNSA